MNNILVSVPSCTRSELSESTEVKFSWVSCTLSGQPKPQEFASKWNGKNRNMWKNFHLVG
jgi:hypothetical protein